MLEENIDFGRCVIGVLHFRVVIMDGGRRKYAVLVLKVLHDLARSATAEPREFFISRW